MSRRKPPRRVMFPTHHDIALGHLPKCLDAIEQILVMESVETLLIVSKPHLDCITKICSDFEKHKRRIMFRFTIGSVNDDTLKFWEPNAPQFEERLDCLKHAHEKGFATSVSCEPMLDLRVEDVIAKVEDFVSGAIWVGRGNDFAARVKGNCPGDAKAFERAERLIKEQDDAFIWELYHRILGNEDIRCAIKWKESIKKVVGLPIPVEPGTDE